MKTLLWIMLIATLATLSCEDDNNSHADNTRSVTYKVEGTSTASITLETDEGGVAQFSDRALPWTKAYDGFMKGDFSYLSAQNDVDHGYVKVTIIVDGVNWKTTTSNGAYVIATASGSLE